MKLRHGLTVHFISQIAAALQAVKTSPIVHCVRVMIVIYGMVSCPLVNHTQKEYCKGATCSMECECWQTLCPCLTACVNVTNKDECLAKDTCGWGTTTCLPCDDLQTWEACESGLGCFWNGETNDCEGEHVVSCGSRVCKASSTIFSG